MKAQLVDTDRGFPYVTAFLVHQTGFRDCLRRTSDQSQIPSWLSVLILSSSYQVKKSREVNCFQGWEAIKSESLTATGQIDTIAF